MKGLLLFFLPMCFYPFPSIASDTPSKSKLKSALSELQDHLDDSKPLTSNPLRHFDFKNFASRAYLYYYRAVGDALVSKSKDDSDKMRYLDQALEDLDSAKTALYFDPNRLTVLANTLLKDKAQLAFHLHQFPTVIETVEKLSRSDQTDNRYILYYGYALYRTSQKEAFQHLAKRYLNIFKDEKLVQAYLGTTPEWNAQLGEIKEDTIYFKSRFTPKINYPKGTVDPYKLDEEITSLWKKKDLTKAERLSRSFLKYQWHPLYGKVLFNLARIQEDGKQYVQAAKTYEKFLKESDDQKLYELAQFRHAWMYFLAKRDKKAKPLFETYLANYPEGRYASTAEYFLLRLEKPGKNRSPKKEELADKYINTYPLGFYSILLMDELNLKDESLLKILSNERGLKAVESQYSAFKADIATLGQLKIYRELSELGLKADASKTLKSFPFDERNDLFTLYLAAQFHTLDDANGEASNLIRIFTNFEQFRKYVPWKCLFPDYHVDSIRDVIRSQALEVSPYLILSLIRQESAFDPEARSTANAMGLMQMTQSTARGAATALNMKEFSLLNESDNLKIGIQTFSTLLKKYHNRLDYALSAYNAGEAATQLWIDLRGHLQPIEFIESIPYQETRMYVKNILRNYAVYRLLYDKRPRTLISYNLVADLK